MVSTLGNSEPTNNPVMARITRSAAEPGAATLAALPRRAPTQSEPQDTQPTQAISEQAHTGWPSAYDST